VIGGQQRCRSAVQPKARELEALVVVDVIQVEEREQPGISAPRAEVHAHVDAPKVGGEQRDEQRPPVVEVSEKHPGAGEVRARPDHGLEEPGPLLAPLGRRRAEVHVEHVQQRPVSQPHVHAQAAALLPPGDAQVVEASRAERQRAQDDVAVPAPEMAPHRPEVHIEAQLPREVARLVLLGPASGHAQHLLERHHVRPDLPEHPRDPLGTHAPVEAAALVDVVGDHPEERGARRLHDEGGPQALGSLHR
jgi:hypothetical protein